MELDYFISKSSRASSSEKDKWLDSSSVATREFTRGKTYQITGISGNSDFSLFFTFDRASVQPGSLVSNYFNTSGFAIGFNSNNQLFAIASNPSNDNYIFNTRFSRKNCIGIIKSDNRINVLNYDLNSKKIYQTDSFTFSPETLISGTNFKLGRNSSLSGYNMSGVSGIFDQMVLFNSSLDLTDAETIFSGFLPLSVSTTTVYGFKSSSASSFELKKDSLLSSTAATNFIPFLNYLSTGVLPTNTGNYSSLITGVADNSIIVIDWSGYYISGENLTCSFTGSKSPVSGKYLGWTPILSQKINFSDQIYVSMNANSERVVSHLFSFNTSSYPDVDDYFSYDLMENYTTKSTSSLTTTSESYKSGFYMSGIVVDELHSTLSVYPDKTFEDVGINLPFDIAKQRFKDTEDFEEGYNLYWNSTKIESYYIEEGFIETSSVEENKTYRMIFDKSVSNPVLKNSNFTHSTGEFPRGTAVVLAGPSIPGNLKRQPKSNFIETSNLDKLNGRINKSINVTFDDLYYNDSLYWSGDMMNIPLTPP